jgi:SAM-dependent methyltransferase
MPTLTKKIQGSPGVLRLAYRLMAPGWPDALAAILQTEIIPLPARALLEVGCGPGTSIVRGVDYHGIDTESAFLRDPTLRGAKVAEADAARLPFHNDVFDLVYTVGVLHHLAESQVTQALIEFARVLRPDGNIVIIDNIWPTARWNLTAYAIRKLDRGKHVRTRSELSDLVVTGTDLRVNSNRHYDYSLYNLECCALRLQRR